jgi:hypothetical protein
MMTEIYAIESGQKRCSPWESHNLYKKNICGKYTNWTVIEIKRNIFFTNLSQF